MKTITNQRFYDFIKTLKVVCNNGKCMLIDEVGEVCIVDSQNCTSNIEDTICIDGYEFKLTDKQKDELYAMAYERSEEHIRQSLQYLRDCRDEDNLRDYLNTNYR